MIQDMSTVRITETELARDVHAGNSGTVCNFRKWTALRVNP